MVKTVTIIILAIKIIVTIVIAEVFLSLFLTIISFLFHGHLLKKRVVLRLEIRS